MTYEYFFTKQPARRDSYPQNTNLIGTNTFAMKTFIRKINKEAFGAVFYTAPLTDSQIKAYGLVKGGKW